MILPQLTISPALSLDVDLISDDADRKTIYQTTFAGSRISTVKPWSTWQLFSAKDILLECGLVAEFFARISKGGADATLLGGYVFHDEGKYVFGAGNVYSYHQKWDWAFQAMLRTTPVEFQVESSRYKFIRKQQELTVLYPGGEICTPYVQFTEAAVRAMEENQNLKRLLSEELVSRGVKSDSDLLLQLLGETKK